MSERPLTPQEINAAKIKGIQVPEDALIDDQTGEVFQPQQSAAPPAQNQQPGKDSSSIPGFVARQTGFNLLPSLAGGLAGAGILAAQATPVGWAGDLLAGGGALAAALATRFAQDKAIKAVGPQVLQNQLAKSEEEAAQHPYYAALAQLPSAGVGGGSFLPQLSKSTAMPLRQALRVAGTQAGLNVAGQLATGGNVDIGPTLLAAAAGTRFARPSAISSALMSRVGLNAPPAQVESEPTTENLQKSQDAMAAQAPAQGTTSIEPPASGVPDDVFLRAPLDRLKSIPGQLQQSIVALRESGMDITPEDIARLRAEGPNKGWKPTVSAILTDKLPADVTQTERLQAASAKNQQELDKLAQAQAIPAPPVEAPKSAQESAAVIQERPGQYESVQKDLDAFKRKQTVRNGLAKMAEKLPDGDPQKEELGSLVDNLDVELAGHRDRLIQAGAEKLIPGGEAPEIAPIKPAASPEVVSTPTTSTATAPAPEPPKAAPAPVEEPFESPVKPGVIIQFADGRTAKIKVVNKNGTVGWEGNKMLGIAKTVLDKALEQGAATIAPPETETNPAPIKPVEPAKPVEASPSGPAPVETAPGKTPAQIQAELAQTEAKLKANEMQAAKNRTQVQADLSAPVQPTPQEIAVAKGQNRTAGQEKSSPYVKSTVPIGTKYTNENGITFTKEARGWRNEKGFLIDDATAIANMDKAAISQTPARASAVQGERKGEAGAILNPFSSRLGDVIEEATNKIKAGVKSGLEKVNSFNPIELLARGKYGEGPFDVALKPSFKVAADAAGKLSQRFAKGMNDTEIGRVQVMNAAQGQVREILKGASAEDDLKIGQWLNAKRYGETAPALTPEQEAMATKLQKFYKDVVPSDAPWVRDHFGNERPREDIPNYSPPIESKESIKIRRGPESQEKTKLREDYIKWVMDRGNLDRPQAEEMWRARYEAKPGNSISSPEFAGLRHEESLGLPPSMREPSARQTALTYSNRLATDYSYSKNIEQDPQLAKGLGHTTNGRGVEIPDTVLDEEGKPIRAGVLAGNEGVRQVLKEYMGSTDAEAREFEKIRNVFSAPLLGPVSRLRHGLIAQNALREIMTPAENELFVKAANKLFSDYSGARQDSLRAGSQRLDRNINPAMAADMLDGVTQAVDTWSKITGAEKLSEINMTFIDQVARLMAKNRIAKGDLNFMDKFGPKDWRTMPVEKVIDHIAANITRISWGTYTGKDLPAWLTRGHTSLGFAPFFALSRAPIGRFNSWYDNVWTPAKQGNIGPLLHNALGAALTAGAINWIKQQITGRKPEELTWEEYLKLGGKDTAMTLFSKAATAGYAGILSELAKDATEMYYNGPAKGFNSPTFIAEDSIIERVGQWMHSFQRGEAGISDLPRVAMEVLKDQVQVMRMLNPPVERGMREERIARRIGYMPPETDESEQGRPNPFSANQAYLTDNPDIAANIIRRKIAQGQRIAAPTSELRTDNILGPDGQIRNYYKFIEDAQGKEAADAAMNRDIENTVRKYRNYTSALTGR